MLNYSNCFGPQLSLLIFTDNFININKNLINYCIEFAFIIYYSQSTDIFSILIPLIPKVY